MNILDFYKMKAAQSKITVVTCYDYSSARILSETPIDALLVGDSVAVTMHGYEDTLSATLEMMCLHTRAVKRGAPQKFIIADMPFMSYRQSRSKSVKAAMALMQAGANAIKLEAADGNLALIKHLTESGIPVMGHLGLTPQFVHALGGYRVQGKTDTGAEKIKTDALALQQAGCFSLVLECVPAKLANDITTQLTIPTIGIGAGADTDGQVLVLQDLLGMNIDFLPKFVKKFASLNDQIKKAIEAYIHHVKNEEFPGVEHCYDVA